MFVAVCVEPPITRRNEKCFREDSSENMKNGEVSDAEELGGDRCR